jgi:hypothetical protein
MALDRISARRSEAFRYDRSRISALSFSTRASYGEVPEVGFVYGRTHERQAPAAVMRRRLLKRLNQNIHSVSRT